MKAKRQIIRLVCLLILTLTLTSSLSVFSTGADDQANPPPKPENCRAACLYDKTHNKILVMENGDALLNTSTSAKVMMGYLACEILANRLNETVTVTEKMLGGTSGYSMRLSPGEQMKIIDLLYGAICGSYNDAGYVIANLCAGSSQNFVDLMNERAKKLGATSTYYTNPLGFPDNDAMVTTLSDTLKITVAASDNQLYMDICSAKKHEIGATNLSSPRTVHNRNYLLSSRNTQAYFNPVCSGLNAGISGEAGGWSIITLARDDGADYICIILGGEESEDGSEIYAYNTANKLINWACRSYNLHKVFSKGQILGKADVGLTALGSEKVDYAAATDLSVYIPDSAQSNISYKVHYASDKLTAPISAGETIGTATVYCNGDIVGKCDVVLTADCEVNAVMQIINVIGNYTKSRAFLATLICFVILLPSVLILKNRNHRGRGRYNRRF